MKEEDKNNDNTKLSTDEEIKLSKLGRDSGIGLTTLGGIGYGLGKHQEHLLKVDPEVASKYFSPEKIKKLKLSGKVLAGIGVPLAGYSIYRHHKYKNKKKNEDKEKN